MILGFDIMFRFMICDLELIIGLWLYSLKVSIVVILVCCCCLKKKKAVNIRVLMKRWGF